MPFQPGQSGNPEMTFKPGQSGNPRGRPPGPRPANPAMALLSAEEIERLW
jgi:hypothetical protein